MNRCVACDKTDQDVPLISVSFRGSTFSICPQHLPILIHDPKMLAGKLPGAEDMNPAEHRD
ncbi:MAG: hypothetical protein OEV30_08400 [Ignavibacteria bacterium]|nr:hypothetical protein [Ignavibacteria bacterium]